MSHVNNQTFGFKPEHVDLLRAVAKNAGFLMEHRPPGYWNGTVAEAEHGCIEIANLIEAILSPREP